MSSFYETAKPIGLKFCEKLSDGPGMVLGGSNFESMTLSEKAESIELKL